MKPIFYNTFIQKTPTHRVLISLRLCAHDVILVFFYSLSSRLSLSLSLTNKKITHISSIHSITQSTYNLIQKHEQPPKFSPAAGMQHVLIFCLRRKNEIISIAAQIRGCTEMEPRYSHTQNIYMVKINRDVEILGFPSEFIFSNNGRQDRKVDDGGIFRF